MSCRCVTRLRIWAFDVHNRLAISIRISIFGKSPLQARQAGFETGCQEYELTVVPDSVAFAGRCWTADS